MLIGYRLYVLYDLHIGCRYQTKSAMGIETGGTLRLIFICAHF